jgi:hypothetical protein
MIPPIGPGGKPLSEAIHPPACGYLKFEQRSLLNIREISLLCFYTILPPERLPSKPQCAGLR